MFVDVLISFEEFLKYGSKRLGLIGRKRFVVGDAFIVDISSSIAATPRRRCARGFVSRAHVMSSRYANPEPGIPFQVIPLF